MLLYHRRNKADPSLGRDRCKDNDPLFDLESNTYLGLLRTSLMGPAGTHIDEGTSDGRNADTLVILYRYRDELDHRFDSKVIHSVGRRHVVLGQQRYKRMNLCRTSPLGGKRSLSSVG